jgi:asparagine synthase (glutamine-hydrolysing)
MCGIAGIVERDGAPIAAAADVAASLGRALAHRGPDASGVWQSPAHDVLLVHRRLAIIDPGPDGAQPMTLDEGRLVIVFNGEVYNYRELRRELEAKGHRFKTASDTEVLGRFVAVMGPRALARVRGMFAFALWNADARTLLLARDRFGIKPLYVVSKGSSVRFASELGALKAARLVDSAPSAAAVMAFLAWGSVPPPLAWNRDVEMLEAGTWQEWGRDRAGERGRFADAREPYRTVDEPVRDEGELGAAVADAVRSSVRAHLVADVPVGVFLSGGIDSGALVSCATSVGATNLRTFTVGFDDESSEADRAASVAATFGTTHAELHLNASSVGRELPEVVARLDQPTIDAVNSYFVSRAVAATGIKAVLSGAGGDELFCGYPSFTRIPRAMQFKRATGPLWAPIAALGGSVLPTRLQARWRHFAASNGNIVEAYRVQRGFLMPEELAALAGPALSEPSVWHAASDDVRRVEQVLLNPLGSERPAASVARLESRLYLQSQLLRDLDVMSMAHGLEVRVPFVDHELVTAVWPELGRHAALRAGKPLLHSTLDRRLPPAVVGRPKQGFTLPFARWMRGDLAPFVQDGLERLARQGWIAPHAPSHVWDDWLGGRTHWSRPWGLGTLGHFVVQG